MISAPQTDPKRGILLMLLAVLLFTAMDALAKGLVARYPTPQVIWARFAGQFLLVLLVLNIHLPRLARTRFPVQHLFRSLAQLGATGFFFLSLNFIGLAEATALTDINPVLITLGAAVFLGERLGPRRIFGVIAAMAGAMIVIRPGLAVFSPAALLPLCCAVSYAAAALLTRKVGAQESAWTSMIMASVFGTLVMSVAAPIYWQPIAWADLKWFALLGALGTGAQLALIRAFSLAEASVIAPYGYVGLIMATFWGIVLYGEYPDLWTLVGAGVIVAAGLYIWHRETQAARAASSSAA